MQDAMVTVRMSKEKKEAGARVLKALGQTASEAINEFYDHLIAQRENPFASQQKKIRPGVRRLSSEQRAKGKAFLEAIKAPTGVAMPDMTKDEMREEILLAKGLLSEDVA